jgi:hypothetical protein
MLVGDLKSLHSLWVTLASNQRYSGLVDEADIKTFTTRLENEGITFLTTVLPELGRALDSFHATTAWISPSGFASRDGYPLFLGVPIKLALGGNSLAVDCIRQLSYMFYKLEVEHDKETVADFLSTFKRVDSESAVFGGDENHLDDDTVTLLDTMKRIIGRILCNYDPLDIRPSHGSGSTACRTVNSQKYHLLRYYPLLDDVYDYPTYFFFSATHLSDELQKLEEASLSTPQARVVLVPKDSRGPRVISCEPAELMYIQQGIMRLLYGILETHDLTKGYLNFADQEVNRKLAHLSSLTGAFATIDLSDASDRVSLSLVRRVFPPNWVRCLEACRSSSTILPNGEVVELNKFAPMGSSCCFPVEALVFWACALATMRKVDTCSNVKPFVYGDDIIIPSALAADVMVGLESIGLKVNRNKSYVRGPFRESCGGDYHNGMDVTPIRVRKFLSITGTGLATTASLANQIIAKYGYESAHQSIRSIEDSVNYTYPRTLLPYPTTIMVSPSASNDVLFRRRWNIYLHRYEYRIPTIAFKKRQMHDSCWSELLRKELSRELRQDAPGKYVNPLAIEDCSLEPGWYTDAHSVHRKWQWSWLG